MTVLLEARFPRTLDLWLRRFAAPEMRGAGVQGWLFEDEAARRDAEERLAAAGVAARLRSAYKPLVHAFLEEIGTGGIRRAEIVYPVHPEADPGRFLIEAYPLEALLAGADVTFRPGGAGLAYAVTVERRDGAVETVEVFAPNRIVPNHLGGADLCPTGWLRVADGPEGASADEAVETETEALFRAVLRAVTDHPFPAEPPLCERLVIAAAVPGIERALPFGEEAMSTREALHEDLYFSLVEAFRARAGLALDDRSLQTGQIVPDIRAADGDAEVRVALESFGEPHDPPGSAQPLAEAGRALDPDQVEAELAALPGERFEGRSREGRRILGLHRAGARPPVLVTAAQHANETSGVAGALRAARHLLADPDANLALIPVENPDGYALHRRLRAVHPLHMHHAARYTAWGSDLDAGPPERAPVADHRWAALARSGARLHVNLHGYPAHEWTRPFTGYLPRGFEPWTLPKGFMLILRHHPGFAETGLALVRAVATALAAVPGLAAFNARQIAASAAHGVAVPGELVAGIPCLVSENTRHPVPLTLITEFPDETIEGDAFRLAHTVQMAAVLAAEAAYAALTAGEGGASA